MEQISTEPQPNPRDLLEGMVNQLGEIAQFASNNIFSPVVVLVQSQSPWAVGTKLVLSNLSFCSGHYEQDGFLIGCSDHTICEIAARSAPTIAEHLMAKPEEHSAVKIVMFYQRDDGLRIACADISIETSLH